MPRRKSQRQHMTPEGPKDCGAKSPASCPMKDENGNPAEHFDNAELANKAWEEKNHDKAMGKISKSKKEKPSPMSAKEISETRIKMERNAESLKFVNTEVVAAHQQLSELANSGSFEEYDAVRGEYESLKDYHTKLVSEQSELNELTKDQPYFDTPVVVSDAAITHYNDRSARLKKQVLAASTKLAQAQANHQQDPDGYKEAYVEQNKKHLEYTEFMQKNKHIRDEISRRNAEKSVSAETPEWHGKGTKWHEDRKNEVAVEMDRAQDGLEDNIKRLAAARSDVDTFNDKTSIARLGYESTMRRITQNRLNIANADKLQFNDDTAPKNIKDRMYVVNDRIADEAANRSAIVDRLRYLQEHPSENAAKAHNDYQNAVKDQAEHTRIMVKLSQQRTELEQQWEQISAAIEDEEPYEY